MSKNLVIVESPAKVKTIKKYLGSSYDVAASLGHVRDLPKSRMGIDMEHDYEPEYITIRGKGELLADLRKRVKAADRVYLATDPDREGEAISWHLYAALKLADKPTSRITFNEITKTAVQASLKNARQIDMNLVDAQQARRCLDRVVGYSISPLLWNKVGKGLSAGRVQSSTLHMVCEREKEISAFIPEEYWTLDALFAMRGAKKPLVAKLSIPAKSPVKTEQQMQEIIRSLKGETYVVSELKDGKRVSKPYLPFTTSTMQQEAGKALGYGSAKTMKIAQSLYESGIITYLRTDSTRVSDDARQMAASYITTEYGKQYLGAGASAKSRSGVQDAHEAIRPTDLSLTPEAALSSLPRDNARLYGLIWRRFTASQMSEATFDTRQVKIKAGQYTFTASGQKRTFDGYLKVYKPAGDEEDGVQTLPPLTVGQELPTPSLEPKQHYTQPPAHYTEATLVRAMEEAQIGRPSTYAPTIQTLIARRYVTKEQKNLLVTDLGDTVDGIMTQEFPDIVNAGFTADMEGQLDSVAEGAVPWKQLMRDFCPKLLEDVKRATEELGDYKQPDEETDEICEKCGRRMVIKHGRNGKFIACPGFPECRNSKPFYEKIGVACPKCGADIAMKISKKGRKYYGCTNSDCDFVCWDSPTGARCPKCGNLLVRKGKRVACCDRACGYVEP